MIFRNLIILISFILVIGCEQYTKINSSKLDMKHEKKYKNIGFSLIYHDDLDIKIK